MSRFRLAIACLAVLLPMHIAFAIGGSLTVRSTIDFNGFDIISDSFNSTNSSYSTGGLYDASKAQDHGDLVTSSSASNAISLGNSKIKGTVHSGPGGTIQLGPSGSVGDKNWVDGGNYGIQPGHWRQEPFQFFPDAALPDTGGAAWLSAAAGNYVIGGVTYKYQLNASKPWYIDNLDGSVYVNGVGVKLWVRDILNLPANGEIRIPANKSLAMYVGATNATIGGNGVINDTGLARSFQYYGLAANTSLVVSANAAFIGQIYAPRAAFTLGAGGSNQYDFVGSCLTWSVIMNGSFQFHYDESLTIPAYSTPAAVLSVSVNPTNHELWFTNNGVPGYKYAIETSTNLLDWVSVLTNSSPFIFTDTNTSNFFQRFYRSLYLP